MLRRNKPERHLPLHTDLYSPFSEAYRKLKINIEFAGWPRGGSSLAIVSADAGEGRTTVAAHLAFSYAGAGQRVLLIDADLRAPFLQTLVGEGRDHPDAVGLAAYLARESLGWADVVQSSAIPNADLIPAGAVPPNPSDLLISQRMDELIAEAKRRYDVVIVDTPPLSLYVDAKVVAAKCDGALFVVRSRKVKSEAAQAAVEQLRLAKATVLGAVLNQVPQRMWKL